MTVDDPNALTELAAVIGGEGGQGRLQLRLRVEGKEVEFDLPQGVNSTPRQRNTLMLLDGVREVTAL